MANVTIPDLTLLTSIDRAADLFEVSDTSDSGNSKRTTVNNMLNITSQPLALTDAQSPTNKTFDNTNIFTVRDDRLTLQDSADTTKQAVFQLSGITTGTTRTYTLPNVTDTLVSLTATQTLTNKTLTSPTISAPTITNPTITVDTISEFTGANGVTIDGLNIKDSKLNTNNSVVTANITNAAVTSPKLTMSYGFRAYHNVNQSSGNAAFAKMSFNTEDFDPSGNFASSRFTAPITGYYLIGGRTNTTSTPTRLIISIFKNGSEYARGQDLADDDAQAAGSGVTVTTLMLLNATDYVEIYSYGNTTLTLEGSNPGTSYFWGYFVGA